MFEIKNGFLYRNGERLFVLGESYYPSFHPCKFPVPPEGDRIGEMVKDLRMMAEAGFNHVRFAALGEGRYDGGENRYLPSTPFVDAMIEEADRNGLSVSVRLQGFAVNLRGFEDGDVLDGQGRVPDFAWSDFVRTTANHQGILEDNYIHARDLAAHFSEFPSVVGAQIYNEPKFPQPNKTVCDYNPHSVAAFRTWLCNKGVLSAEEASSYEPPRRPGEQDPRMWALWRQFSTERINAFLDNAAKGSKAGADRLATFTCLTADTACKTNPRRGVDPFADAKSMDFVGYTIYKHAWGAEYYPMCLDGDIFQSAAELEGSQAWCVELDSRTYIPPSVYNRGTYATVGSGVKGIIYYQWRGDCPVPGVPHPNSCGILNYDGTKTKNFDNALAVNRWIASVNDLLIGASRPQEGIGLLYSAYGAAFCDGMCNGTSELEQGLFLNPLVNRFADLYTELRRAGYTVTVVDGEHLSYSPHGIRVLTVPDLTLLSEEELAAVDRFREAGGEVYIGVPVAAAGKKSDTALSLYDSVERVYEDRVFLPPITPYDLPDRTGIRPIALSRDPLLGVQVLQGADYTLLVLTNLSTVKDTVEGELRVSIPYTSAELTSVDGRGEVRAEGERICVTGLTDGGMLILR